jgi:DNA-binding transcriptional MerR regulator/effector-binding domain-containing protein
MSEEDLMRDAEFLTAGELAALCGLNKKTVFHYDKIGLIKPSYRDEQNNYRYYSPRKVITVLLVKSLQDTGMQLDEIKEYLDARGTQKSAELLSRQLSKIEKQITDLQMVAQYAKGKIRSITSEIILDQPFMESLEDYNVIITRNPQKKLSPDQLFVEHIRTCRKYGLSSMFCVNYVYEYADILAQQYNIISSVFTPVHGNINAEAELLQTRGEYVSIYQQGDYSNIDKTYSAVFEYIKHHGLTALGDFYEEAIVDDFFEPEYKNQIFKISIRVNSLSADSIGVK